MLVALCAGIAEGILDHTASFYRILFGVRRKIGAREHDIGNIRVLFADRRVKAAVRLTEIFGRGRVMVVIADKGAHGQLCHICGDGKLRAGVAGKAEVDEINVKAATYHSLIRKAGTRGAGALRDG